MARLRVPAPRFPALSVPGDLCESRSMVHMRPVNSAATPDRGNGMGHQLAYHAAVDGKPPVSRTSPTSELFANTRRLTFAAAAVFMTSLATPASYAQSSGPYAGMAGN